MEICRKPVSLGFVHVEDIQIDLFGVFEGFENGPDCFFRLPTVFWG